MFHDYIIADCRLRLSGAESDLVAMGLKSFQPFEVEPAGEPLLTVEMGCRVEHQTSECKPLTEFDFEEGQARCRFSRVDEGWLLEIVSDSQPSHLFLYERNSNRVLCNAGVVDVNLSFVRFGLWFMLNIATTTQRVAAVHSSVIVKDGRAVMFLGESGTGKSTHTRLWRENIGGAVLLNDDSPFVRATTDGVVVYGSPWSGKTPCYTQEHYPLQAIVRLSQAPHNRMRCLRAVEAIGALLPSLPPAFAFDKELEDATLNTLSALLRGAKVYHLECLPDAAAARLSYETVFGNEAQ